MSTKIVKLIAFTITILSVLALTIVFVRNCKASPVVWERFHPSKLNGKSAVENTTHILRLEIGKGRLALSDAICFHAYYTLVCPQRTLINSLIETLDYARTLSCWNYFRGGARAPNR